MEQAQLFKRLYDMTMDDLTSFIQPSESIRQALFKLDLGARTRHIINAIQLEDIWQSMPEGSDTFNIYLAIKLSPTTLASCLDLNHDMNSLEWRFVLPKYSDIPEGQKPERFDDYLEMNKKLEILEIDNCDIEKSCQFLDKAYDFSPHQIQQSRGVI